MIKAVLLDLDDTLLHNPTNPFLGVYLEAVDRFFQKLWGVESLSAALARGARAVMNGKDDLRHTNLSVLIGAVQQATGRPTEAIQAAFDQFYATEYAPATRPCTRPVKSAPELVRRLTDAGYAVVIATNPIYPADAIRQRMAWAGLSPNFDDYAFVTRADNMHFAKPDPAYYAEILGRIGVEPDEAIMIGNDPRNDIAASSRAGLYNLLTHADRLHDVLDAIPTFEEYDLRPISPETITPQLKGNVGALFGLVDGVKPHQWTQHPDPREWSPLQIVCHLLDKEQNAMRHRLERILSEDNPFIAESEPLGPDEALPCDIDGVAAAERFREERLGLIDLVNRITAEQWARRARHSIFGNTTLLEMAYFTAQHDRLHLRQLCQTIGKCV